MRQAEGSTRLATLFYGLLSRRQAFFFQEQRSIHAHVVVASSVTLPLLISTELLRSDSLPPALTPSERHKNASHTKSKWFPPQKVGEVLKGAIMVTLLGHKSLENEEKKPVSYTHLTLPTKA